jgi:hypothetical protein
MEIGLFHPKERIRVRLNYDTRWCAAFCQRTRLTKTAGTNFNAIMPKISFLVRATSITNLFASYNTQTHHQSTLRLVEGSPVFYDDKRQTTWRSQKIGSDMFAKRMAAIAFLP